MAADPSLSERELEILRRVATGASNKDIARQLGISPNTVKVHLRNVFSKIGVDTRTAATLVALKSGWLEAPPAARSLEPSSLLPTTKRRARPALWLLAALALLASFTALPRAAPQPPPTAAPAAISRWQEQPGIPAPLAGMAAAGYEGALYLLGGEDAGGASAGVYRYQPGPARWEARAPRPAAVSGAQAAVLGEKIYVPGGQFASGEPCARLDAYDPRLDRWEARAPLPWALAGGSVAALEGRLYLFGGWDGQRERDEVLSYDPRRDEWSLVGRLPGPRAFSAAAALEGKVLLLGGQHAGEALRSALAFYPQRAAGGEAPWEYLAPLPEPRTRASAATLAGMVYLAGGEGEGGLLQFQPRTGRWLALESAGRPPAGVGPALVALETRLHLLGGRTPGGLSDRHRAYQAIYTLLAPMIE